MQHTNNTKGINESSTSHPFQSRNQHIAWDIILRIANIVIIFGMPWAIWTTNNIFEIKQNIAISKHFHEQLVINSEMIRKHDLTLAELKSWKDIGPRFTASDAENLQLKISSEIEKKAATVADAADKKISAASAETDKKIAAVLQEINQKLNRMQQDITRTQTLIEQQRFKVGNIGN